MPDLALIVAACVIVVFIVLWIFGPRAVARLATVLLLFAVAGFCIFGFMASYEYADVAKRLPWQIGYGVLGLTCLSGAVMLLRLRRGG